MKVRISAEFDIDFPKDWGKDDIIAWLISETFERARQSTYGNIITQMEYHASHGDKYDHLGEGGKKALLWQIGMMRKIADKASEHAIAEILED